MPRGKQAPAARGEDDASSDDSMSSGFLTHSTLDEQRFSFSPSGSTNFAQKLNECWKFSHPSPWKGIRGLLHHAAQSRVLRLLPWQRPRWLHVNLQGARLPEKCWQLKHQGNHWEEKLLKVKEWLALQGPLVKGGIGQAPELWWRFGDIREIPIFSFQR